MSRRLRQHEVRASVVFHTDFAGRSAMLLPVRGVSIAGAALICGAIYGYGSGNDTSDLLLQYVWTSK